MSAAVDYKVTSKPNNSLTSAGRIKLVLFLAVIPLSVAVAFAIEGVWVALPFAGLELTALAYAFYYINCHAEDYESITIEDSRLVVERRNNKHASQYVLNPYWAKVVIENAPSGMQLRLRSHGKDIEIGYFMNSEERADLALQLQQRTGTIYGGNNGT